MGRLGAAIEAGRQAVAARERLEARARAVLAVGLDAPALLSLARGRVAPAGPGRLVLVADGLPTALVGQPAIVFEHMPPLADLLTAATPAEAQQHRLRRLFLILRRWDVAECLWTGGEAEELVRLAAGQSGAAVTFRRAAPTLGAR